MRAYRSALTDGGVAGWLGVPPRTERASTVLVLAGAGLALSAACWWLARVPNLVLAPRTFLVLFTIAWLAYACGVLVSARSRTWVAVVVILTVGVLSRMLLLPALPTLSTDAYRYVWDARLSSAGIDPYAYAPVDPEVAGLRDTDIYPRLNHLAWRTVYPPVAQAFFGAVYRLAPDNVLAMKLAFGIGELLALACVLLLLRTLDIPIGRLTIYAWNPLLLVEVWGSGHLDALVLAAITTAALASARRRDGLAAILLGLGSLVKIYPVVLLLLLPGRRRISVCALFAATVVAGSIAAGGFGRWPIAPIWRYVEDEYFNPGLVRTFVNEPLLALVATAAWMVVIASQRRAGSLAEQAGTMAAGVIVLGANVFPWYVVWLVPFLAVTPSIPLIAFTGSVGFAYSFFMSEPWTIPTWARLVEVAPLAIAAVLRLRNAFGWLPGLRARPGTE
jgi:hypothetical protein